MIADARLEGKNIIDASVGIHPNIAAWKGDPIIVQ